MDLLRKLLPLLGAQANPPAAQETPWLAHLHPGLRGIVDSETFVDRNTSMFRMASITNKERGSFPEHRPIQSGHQYRITLSQKGPCINERFSAGDRPNMTL
jgi:hypothetical protein